MERLNVRNAARLRSIIRTFPATLLIEALILLVAGFTASGSDARHDLLVNGVGLDLHKVLSVQLWTLPVSTLVQSTPGIGMFLAIFVAGALGLLEYLAGSWRAAVIFFLSDWISAPLTILVAW